MRLRRMALAPRLDQVAILRQIIGHVDGEPVYAICGADGEGSGNGDGGGANNGDDKNSKGGSGKDDDEDDDEEDDEAPPKGTKDYKTWYEHKRLRDEAARRRVKAREANERADALQAKLDELEQKDMSDLQKAQADAEKFKATTEQQAKRIEDMQVELAFLKMPREKYDWHDPGAALTLLAAEHRGELTLNEDGTVDGLDQAVKALAKKHKFLLRVPGTNGNGEENGDKGGSTGGSFGSGGDRGGDANKAYREKAASRFRLH
jgi:hypothetical protein